MLYRMIGIASKLLLAHNSADFPQIYDDLKPSLLAQCSSVPFDASWYVTLYPDVAAAVTEGQFADAYEHFSRSGFLAGRLGASMPVDEGWYRSYYVDIQRALSEGKIASAAKHFHSHGFFEGRAASAYHLVDRNWYMTTYSSVASEVEAGLFSDPQDHYNRRGYALGYWASKWSATAV
jgi:hypothetical protein